jgi:hypothetical protein
MSHGLSFQANYTWSKALADYNIVGSNQDSGDPNNSSNNMDRILTTVRSG